MMQPVLDTTNTHYLKGVSLPDQGHIVDLRIVDGIIADIQPSKVTAETVLLPLMADVHVHLDKTFTARRTGVGATSLFDAIARIEADKPNWTQDDLYQRGTEALTKAYRHGVAAMRSHVDWVAPETPMAWPVLNELKKEWHGRVDLQLASLSPIDLLQDAGESIAAKVHDSQGVLGAFVYRNDSLAQKLTHIFALSDTYNLPLDFHVDEGLEIEAQGFDFIVAHAAKRPKERQVLCGHACALSIRTEDDVKRILASAAEAQIGLVVLPTTNMYLQDHATARTPRLRGIAPIHEAKAAGVEVLIASDNVRDLFYPYGDYDLLDVFRGCLDLAHLDPLDWLDTISHRPARWCLGDSIVDTAVGQPANFVTIDTPDLYDAFSRPAARRTVYRDGRKLL